MERKKKNENPLKRAKTRRVGGSKYSGKVGLGCNEALLETSTWEVGEERGRDGGRTWKVGNEVDSRARSRISKPI